MNTGPSDKNATLPAAALTALAAGNKIDAIKVLREQTGLDLKDAKDLIERYMSGPSVMAAHGASPDAADNTFPSAATAALYKGSKIEAIRIVREQQRIGLKDAKEIVERYLLDQPLVRTRLKSAQAEAGRRLLVRLIVIALLVAAGYYLATA